MGSVPGKQDCKIGFVSLGPRIGLFNRDWFFQSRALAEAVSMPRNIVIRGRISFEGRVPRLKKPIEIEAIKIGFQADAQRIEKSIV